jgi:hypothetical protein
MSGADVFRNSGEVESLRAFYSKTAYHFCWDSLPFAQGITSSAEMADVVADAIEAAESVTATIRVSGRRSTATA